MTSRRLAWRTLVADPTRAALAIAAVAIIGALLFNMLLLSRGLLLSFRDLLDTGGYDIRVVAGQGLLDNRMPIRNATTLASAVARLREVKDVAVLRFDRAVAESPGHAPGEMTLLAVTGRADRGEWRMIAGATLPDRTSPADPLPLVISRTLGRVLGLTPGSTLRLRILPPGGRSALPARAFRVVGIADFGFEPPDQSTAATNLDAFRRAEGGAAPDEANILLVASHPAFGPTAALSAIRELRADVHAYSNEEIVAEFNENGFAYFRQISFVLSTITLGFTFLLLATLLTVSVNQRLSEVAALRALGFPRWRIASNLLWESGLLVGAGGILALPLGGLLATGLDRILRTMPGLPERLHFFVFEPRALVLHVALLGASGLAAAAYPIWIAARLPIAATLRREIVS